MEWSGGAEGASLLSSRPNRRWPGPGPLPGQPRRDPRPPLPVNYRFTAASARSERHFRLWRGIVGRGGIAGRRPAIGRMPGTRAESQGEEQECSAVSHGQPPAVTKRFSTSPRTNESPSGSWDQEGHTPSSGGSQSSRVPRLRHVPEDHAAGGQQARLQQREVLARAARLEQRNAGAEHDRRDADTELVEEAAAH